MTQLLTTRQLSEVLSLGSTALYMYRKQGMPHIAISPRTVRYDPVEVRAWLSTRGASAGGNSNDPV